MEQLQPKKWYDNKTVVTLLCIFFFPVGLYALWKSNVISKQWKIINTIIISIFVIIVGSQEPKKPTSAETKDKSEVDSSKITADEAMKAANDAQAMLDSTVSANTAKEQTTSAPEQKPPTDEELINYFQAKYDSVKLIKRWNQAPMYGQYADALAAVFNEIDSYDSVYHILNIPKIKNIYNLAEKKNSEALKNYLKYGEPDEDFIHINSACQTALEEYLNNPDYEILKDKYYLKQTSQGYDYKLIIRGKNSFNADIKKELTFNLKYNPIEKFYYVTKVHE